MAAALGAAAVVALAAASFFFINSRRAPEVQAGTQPAGQAEPSGSTQPAAKQLNQQANQQPDQQPSAGANNQAQQQTKPQPIGEVKSPAVRNDESSSNQQRQAAAKPTPATPQEQQATGGSPNAEQSLNQGKMFLNQRRYQEALAEFERVKSLDPANKDIYYLIGSTYHGMNQLERALEAYRQCTSGDYASVSRDAVKKLEKKVGKVSAK
jgi:tetratricopeptide (TPR) repeat protein